MPRTASDTGASLAIPNRVILRGGPRPGFQTPIEPWVQCSATLQGLALTLSVLMTSRISSHLGLKSSLLCAGFGFCTEFLFLVAAAPDPDVHE